MRRGTSVLVARAASWCQALLLPWLGVGSSRSFLLLIPFTEKQTQISCF